MRISDWSSDACSSDLAKPRSVVLCPASLVREHGRRPEARLRRPPGFRVARGGLPGQAPRATKGPDRTGFRRQVQRLHAEHVKSKIGSATRSARVSTYVTILGVTSTFKKKNETK